MTDSIEIQPVSKPIVSTVQPPGSKSITNRALVCAALAEGTTVLSGALVSEDTQVMVAGLRTLGINIQEKDNGQTLVVTGCGGKLPAEEADIFVANSGTTIRFLTALVTLGHGHYSLDGIARMRERPIGDLRDALNQLGADVVCESENDCPPVKAVAKGLEGGKVSIRGDISSQYLSGLLMAAPCAKQDVEIRVEGTLVSVPYVEMTLAVMRSFGVVAEASADYSKIVVPASNCYQACDYAIEPDASAASYFWAAAAVTGGEVTVTGLSKQSLQGDVEFVDCLAQMGCEVRHAENSITVVGKPLSGIDVDMNTISDTVQTLSVVALFAEGPTKIRNIAHIRHKETDRISAVANELRKLGAKVVESEAGLEIEAGEFKQSAIETYNDHRMAMSFAIAGLREPGVVILNPACTEKTYPKFFEDLSKTRTI